ncbi:carboxypeptidase regulatory-like domain-containing protein [Belliella kenyensis]|uniref:Carboxypeptidase regulatory-like domain-containing protein n=1 Tax=Belliella kenyensis TaxID=1472724 RepID=A0ABV8ENW8_9BACT|nr:carboxypeptidase regulatory-like domain-containing protein [Belliella kenyensis]MCH7402925.1 carboxypeptidase-like regulatory domain-containing protein [Belliella kenyensis]MDN3602631.1 carboxypeptidase regulatory-like domain-containing protein [Belliella kenyensis]
MYNYFTKQKTKALFIIALAWTSITLCPISSAFAQATNATISGLILDDSKEPLIGANVLVKNESTGFEAGTITGLDGRFQLQQLPLGKPYTVTVSYIGFNTQKLTGYQLNQGDRINVEITMEYGSSDLSEVVVTGDSFKNQVDKLGAVTAIDSKQIKNLPTEGRNFTNLTALSPLQGGGGLNLGGQRRTSTNVTLDGVNARNQLTAGEIARGPYTVSIEAIREFEVATNSYDVTQGRQAGGALNAVTKSGTNTLEGSAFAYHRNDNLASPYDIRGNEREVVFNNTQWGFSLGGPIIKDKVHFFTVFDRQDAGEPVFIGDIRNEDDELRLRIRKDTLDKFVDVARRLYGVGSEQQLGEFSRKTVANTFFARIDWQINKRNKLTIRNNYTDWSNPFSVNDNTAINLAEVFGDFSSKENSLLVSLRSIANANTTNELKVQLQHAERGFTVNGQLPSNNMPRAIVRVVSPFPTENNPNAIQTTNVQIGGQRFLPETNLEQQIHIVNTTYTQQGKFNFTFGTDNMVTYLETLLSSEQNGRFFYNSLTDFENNNPFRYAREVPLQGLPIVKQTVVDLSLFGQMEVNPHKDVNLVAGLRYDATMFMNEAAFNPTVSNELGIRTDNKPADFRNLQPRIQATWDIKGKNTDVLKFGAGMFAAQPHYYAQVNNIQNSGVMLAAIDVQGDLVPEADFIGYRNGLEAPGIPEGADFISTINSVADDFRVPNTFKANLNYNKLIGDRFRIGANVIYSYTFNNYVYLERNMVDDPYFRLSNEGNRGVFVPANTIGSNGQTNWLNSRKSNNVGRVLELNSDGEGYQYALILDGSVRLGKDGYITASYTFNQAFDNTSYNCCVANTSTFLPVVDDSRKLNWAYSDNQFKHKIVLNGATPTWRGFTMGATLIGIGGSRYSFLVSNGSLQGDFPLNNALAFVFDPNNPDTPQNIRDGYNAILNDPNTSESTKKYLRESFGKIADRNGGENPMFYNLDLRLLKNIKIAGSQRVELSADVFNFMNMLNKDWGVDNNLSSSRNLQSIRGFDQSSQQYIYNVEQGVGILPINGTPWRIQLGLRYSF